MLRVCPYDPYMVSLQVEENLWFYAKLKHVKDEFPLKCDYLMYSMQMQGYHKTVGVLHAPQSYDCPVDSSSTISRHRSVARFPS